MWRYRAVVFTIFRKWRWVRTNVIPNTLNIHACVCMCTCVCTFSVKLHSKAKDNHEISFRSQRQPWNFILRPRAAVKSQCNGCTDFTKLRNAALQQIRLCIKYSRLVPNVTCSVTYRHLGFSCKNKNKIVWIFGILKCMNLSYMQKCFNDVRISNLKCFSCLSISDKGASEWVSVSWALPNFCVLYWKQQFDTLFLHTKWETLSNVLTEFIKTSCFMQNP